MLLERQSTKDVVVDFGVGAALEPPGLLLGVVGVTFEALELVLEGDDVVSLLVAKGAVLRC